MAWTITHKNISFLFFTFIMCCFVSEVHAQGIWEYIHNGSNCKNHGTAGSCMQSRHEASYVQVGDRFYLLGGREHNSNVNIYDPIKDIWTVGANAPMAIHHFQAVEYNGLILIAGAMTGNFPGETPIPNIMIYDPKTDKWYTGPSIDRPRGSAGVVIHNDKLYLVSGILDGHRSGWVPWLDEYDLKTNTWKRLGNAPHSRDHFHAAIVGDKIVVGGGRRSGESGTFNATEGAVDIYDISEKKWSTNSKDIPTHRAAPCVGVIGNEVIYIGGERNSGDANDETEALNINTGNWRTLTPLNEGRHGTQAIVNNDNIWVASGSPKRGGGQTTTQERFYFGSKKAPSVYSVNRSKLQAANSLSVSNSTKSLVVNNTGGNQAILVQKINLTGSNKFSYTIDQKLPFLVKSGQSFTINVKHTNGSNNTGELVITHSGNPTSISVDLETNNEEAQSFIPDPNKKYYLDVPAHNKRLASTGNSEDAFTESTTSTGANVEWKFVNKGNGYWHLQRAAGGSKPRLRTDATLNADMQETSSSGTYTYFAFTQSTTSGTHYLTLPDGPAAYQRLQMTSNGELRFVTTNFGGGWVSWKITEVPPANKERVVHIRKRNALNYAIDGRSQTFDGQYVHLWTQSSSNVFQQWVEIDRGNGFYSYRKNGTKHCLDGATGGANRQVVSLFECDDSNRNQHWKKQNTDNGFVKLIKRNATGFAINGGGGGAKGQAVNLYNSSNTSHNLQWLIEEVNVAARSADNFSSQLTVSSVFGNRARMEWYFNQSADKPVEQYTIMHSTDLDGALKEVGTFEASEFEGVEAYTFTHDQPAIGNNFYQVIVRYADGTYDYSMHGDIDFEEIETRIQVAPNPTTNNLFIDLDKYMETSVYYFINSIDGKQILEGTWDAGHSNTVELDLANLPNGLYAIYMKPEGYRAVAVKFVVAKNY